MSKKFTQKELAKTKPESSGSFLTPKRIMLGLLGISGLSLLGGGYGL